MNPRLRWPRRATGRLLTACAVLLGAAACPLHAAEPGAATALKFAEMYRLPIGPRGVEPTPKLLALDGRVVQLVGYMARSEQPLPGRLLLTPLPVELGDEDERLSDDLPASAVFVHLSAAFAHLGVAHLQGLLQLTGTLRLGAEAEPDGHVSAVRLLLDDADSRRLVEAGVPPPTNR